MATPHFLAAIMPDRKPSEPSLATMPPGELRDFCKGLLSRLEELQKLVQVISRGKYAWEATFDAITEPVMLVAGDYTIQRANLAMAAVSGHDIKKVAGKKCYKVFAGRSKPCDGCPLKASIEGRTQLHSRLENKIAQRDFNVHAYPLYDEQKELHAGVMYYRDVSEELRLRQEVIQQEKMAAIGMLAGGVAHEVNNPLGGILAFTQLILKKLEPRTELYEDMVEIERAAIRCKKIVQDLLDFSRISREKEKCLVYLNELIEKILPFVKMEVRALNIDLQCALGENLPAVFAVPNRLQQVFLNIMTNAVHSMPHGGKLFVRTAGDPKNGEVVITIRDTGTGIPKEIANRIFEPFFTTKEPGRGTGLGLSVSYRIVTESQGKIEVDSKVGEGSCFTIRLPAAPR